MVSRATCVHVGHNANTLSDPQPATAADITEEGVPEARDGWSLRTPPWVSVIDDIVSDFTALEYDPSSNETASAAEAEPRPADEAPHEETSGLCFALFQ